METPGIRRYRIGFLGSGIARGRNASWPETQGFMMRALERYCGEVVPIGPVTSVVEFAGKVGNRVLRAATGKGYDYYHSSLLSRWLSRITERRFSESGCDLLFVAATSTEAAFVSGGIPTVYTSDATFAAVRDYYPAYSEMLAVSVREADALEARMIRRADLLLYPSDWARRSAVEYYGKRPSRVFTVPYAANLPKEDVPARGVALGRRRSGRCRLLFLGVDWVRKGGDIALDTVAELRRLGIPAELTICGCAPPDGQVPEGVRVVPRLDKHDPQERRRLMGLFAESDFLFLPTRGECFGMVFCEASAFGVPSISTDTGGVSGAIREGENGFTLPEEAGGGEYAELIASVYTDEGRYCELVRGSRDAFEERLNWDAWGASVSRLIADVIR